jgi:SAM-dependent methyltransferase
MNDARGPLLVVGCGGADEMSSVPQRVRAIAIDISSTAVQRSRAQYPNHQYVIADASRLPFAESVGFQAILCSEVIEHVHNSDHALEEFCRTLTAGGRLILTTPNWLSWYGLARVAGRLLLRRDLTAGDQPYDRWSTKKELKERLGRTGFDPIRWLGFWYFPPFGKGQNYRLPDRVIIPLLRVLMPIDRALGSLLPALGHVVCVVSVKLEDCDEQYESSTDEPSA